MASLHTDIPTRAQVDRLLTARAPGSVSLYLPTSPASTGDAERIELKNLTGTAADQLREIGASATAVQEHLADLAEDDDFWRYQARSLAIFATEDTIATFRLPNHLLAAVHVSDRFHVKPLLRSITFPQTAFVLALAQGSVRLLEIVPDLAPTVVDVPDLPTDAASAVGRSSIADRAPVGRIQGSEGQKVRLRQYARQVDRAIGPVLPGNDVPLILAGNEPVVSIYRSVCGYPHLADTVIPGALGDAELVAEGRTILDRLHADSLRALIALFDQRVAQGRTATDIADTARFSTLGAVDTVFVDLDATVPGSVDDETGAVTFASVDDGIAYGVVDEIARRVWLTGGKVYAVRRPEVPGGGDVAAILRYAPG